ncbi:hypothetical protein [Nostoc sp.]
MVKLILPDHLITDIEPHLPSDIDVVEVDVKAISMVMPVIQKFMSMDFT